MTRAHGSWSLLAVWAPGETDQDHSWDISRYIISKYSITSKKLLSLLPQAISYEAMSHYYRYKIFKYSNNALHCRRIIRAHISWTFSHIFIYLIIFSLNPFFLPFKLQHIVKNAMLGKKIFLSYDRTMHVLRVLNCRIKFQIRFLISTGLITEEIRCDSSNVSRLIV